MILVGVIIRILHLTLSDPVFSFVEANPDRDADQELEDEEGYEPAEADEANEHDDDNEDRGDGDGELEGDDDEGGEQQLVVLPPQAPGQQELEVELQTKVYEDFTITKKAHAAAFSWFNALGAYLGLA